MQLPRRVPWASLAELEQVCGWIYADDNDRHAKILAIDKLSAWRAITYLPHALESVLSLLTVLLEDDAQRQPNSYLSLRQSYASAVIRLVNGLVDPLQVGTYARSIASIASQLNLPPWLVEIRHAATHEDLPSLELLREAARECMIWLLHNYFLPTLNPLLASPSQPALRPLEPILQRYKSLLKITTRDVSLKSQHRNTIVSVMRDVERWISEAKITANVAYGELGWEPSYQEHRAIDGKEKWALDRLCNALLEKGFLVPLSKRKREFPLDAFHPPRFSVLLWTPLLQHIQSLHPEFLAVLAGRIASVLSPDDGPSQLVQFDQSYDLCLARWARWSIDTWEAGDRTPPIDLRKEVISILMQTQGHLDVKSRRERKAAMDLLESLCSGMPRLEGLLFDLNLLSGKPMATVWTVQDILVMEDRLGAFLSAQSNIKRVANKRCDSVPSDSLGDPAVSGWRLLSECDNWGPCPLGVHRIADAQ